MIDTQAIRKRILDIAISGKLGLNKKDESAPELPDVYDFIEEKEKKFPIPENWRWAKIGWIMSIERGGSPRPIKSFLTEAEDGINWIKIGDVEKGGKYILQTKEKIKPEGEKKSRRVYPGDFLLTNSMSFGRPYISRIEGCVHDGWLILRNTHNLFYFDFLYHLLSSGYMYNQFTKKATGSTVDNLNIDKVADAVVPIPPIDEQVRIVERIETLFQLIDQISDLQRQYANNITSLNKKILDLAVQGKLVPQEPSDEPASVLLEKIAAKCEIPEELENDINPNIRYAHLVDACNGIFDCPHSTPTYCEEFEGYLCLRTRELKVGEIEWDKLLYLTKETYTERVSRYIPKKDDIVYAREGRYGICAIVDKDTPLALGQRLMVFSVNHDLLRSKYLFYALISDFCLKQVTSAQRGMTAAHVNVKDVKKMIIPIPSLEMQDRIVSVVDSLLSKIEVLYRSNNG